MSVVRATRTFASLAALSDNHVATASRAMVDLSFNSVINAYDTVILVMSKGMEKFGLHAG